MSQAENPVHPQLHPANGLTWQPWIERRSRLSLIDRQLERAAGIGLPLLVNLRSERATLLYEQGKTLEARSEFLSILELDPGHMPTLLALGRLLAATGNPGAAKIIYLEILRCEPGKTLAQVNLAAALLETQEPEAARALYEILLAEYPDLPQAHCGMFYALTRLGETRKAEEHRRKGFPQAFIKPMPYRGCEVPVSVLLLVSSNGGNTPIEKLLDDTVFQVYVLVADFYDPHVPLPEHQLVINGIADADLADEALAAAEAILARTSAPVINPLAAVRETGRCDNARRLAGIAGIVTPKTQLFPCSRLTSPAGPIELALRGFTFPVLLRAPGFHMGEHFHCIERPDQLSAVAAELPGTAGLLAIEYLNARGSDGLHRKYRVMFVNGKLYPLHLAISRNWKTHYFSADMAQEPILRREEECFLTDMKAALGARAFRALGQLQQQLGLDYGGVDFSVNADGHILLFEANAAMVVEQPAADPKWDYRRTAVARIHAAVREMLLSRAEGKERHANPLHAEPSHGGSCDEQPRISPGPCTVAKQEMGPGQDQFL